MNFAGLILTPDGMQAHEIADTGAAGEAGLIGNAGGKTDPREGGSGFLQDLDLGQGKVRVLVTRPQPGATRTAGRLADLGYEPVLMPMTRPYLSQPLPDASPGLLLATSPQAYSIRLKICATGSSIAV